MANRSTGSRSLTDTRSRIIGLLRENPATVPELADRLGISYHGVRPHLAALERDGLVVVADLQRGTTRPAAVYQLAPGVEATLSKVYVPFAAELVRVLDERLPDPTVNAIMRDVGRRLARSLPHPRGRLEERVAAASTLLAELGAPNTVETSRGGFRIRSVGCLLAEAVHGRPGVCRALETLLGEVLDAEVTEQCDRGARPRCCFEVRRAG